jgi:spastin
MHNALRKKLGQQMLASIRAEDVRPVTFQDFARAMAVVKPSTDGSQIAEFEDWTRKFGTAG